MYKLQCKRREEADFFVSLYHEVKSLSLVGVVTLSRCRRAAVARSLRGRLCFFFAMVAVGARTAASECLRRKDGTP